MPHTAAEQLVAAQQRLAVAAPGSPEHDQAAEDVVSAEKKLLRRLGVETHSTAQAGLIATAVLIIVVVASMVLNIFFSVTAHTTAGKANDTAQAVQRQAVRIREVQRESVFSNRENCERGNDSRVANIHNLRSDVSTLRTQLQLWEASLAASSPAEVEGVPPPVLDAFTNNLSSLRKGIHRKRASIAKSIASQAKVAVKKGSPRANCVKAFPLPAERQVGPPAPRA